MAVSASTADKMKPSSPSSSPSPGMKVNFLKYFFLKKTAP